MFGVTTTGDLMILLKFVGPELTDRYLTWKTARDNWLLKAKEAKESFYSDVDGTGTLFTKEELASITNLTDIPVSLNLQYPLIDTKLSILTATRPSIRVISVQGDQEMAFVVDKVKHGIFLQSNTGTEIEECTKEGLITGMGGLGIQEPDFYLVGDFNTLVKYIRNEYIILDPNAKDKSLADMEGYWIDKMITLSKAQYLYDHIVSQVKDDQGRDVSWDQFIMRSGTTEWDEGVVGGSYSRNTQVVWTREYYEKVYSEAHYIKDKNGDVQVIFPEDIEPKNKAILETASKKEKGIFIRKHLILGDYVVAVKTMPLTEYPLKMMFYEWGGQPYKTYGMTHFTQPAQDAFNKLIQLFIANGVLSNNAGWRAPKGGIAPDDKKQWEEHGANPYVIKEYVPQEVAGKVLVPEKEQVAQMSSFYPLVLDMLKGSIQFTTGVSDVLTGDAKEAGVDVFSALQQYQSAAMQRVMLSGKHMNDVLELLGRTLVEHIVAYIKPDQNYFFFDEDGEENEVIIAQQVANSVKMAKYKVATTPSTDNPTQRISVATELFKIAQTTSSPAERSLFVNKAIELLDIKETKDLIEKLDVVNNLQSQNAQLEEDLDRQEELNKQMENKMINTDINNKILKKILDKTNALSEMYGRVQEVLNTKTKVENNGTE